MSVSRQDEDMIAIVDGLRKQLTEIKGLQVVGSDAVHTFKNSTSAEWDVTQSLSTIGVSRYFPAWKRIVTFTPDNVVNDQPAGSFKVVTASKITLTPSTIYDATRVTASVKRLEMIDPKIQQYEISVPDQYANADQTGTRQVKIYVLATAKGTVTIST